MKSIWRHALQVVIVLSAIAAAAPVMAQADPVICQASVSTIQFGNIDPTGANVDVTANLQWSCQSNVFRSYYARVCFNIGDGPLGLDGGRRQIAGPGGNLDFQIFSNAPRTQVWGSILSATHPTPVDVTFFIAGNDTVSGNLPVYSRLYGNEPSATVGTYAITFSPPDVRITGLLGSFPGPGDCSVAGSDAGNFAPLNIQATVLPQCTVSASDLNFGASSGFLAAGNLDANAAVSVQCINGTAYQVGLDNGTHAVGNTRRMQGPGGYVNYELYRDSGRTLRWGNTPGSDTVGGSGTGTTQNLTVFGRVPPQPTPAPGAYSDTVTVTVTY